MVGSRSVSGIRVAIAVCAALVVVGVFAPWIRYFFVTWNGIEGGGVLALVFAVTAAAGGAGGILQSPRPRWVPWATVGGFLLATVWGAVIFLVLVDKARSELDSFGFSGIQVLWGFWVYAFSAVAGLVLAIIDGARGAERTSTHVQQPNSAPIVIHNHLNAQGGDNDNRRPSVRTLDGGRARIGVIDGGRPLPDVAASPGMPLLIGRDSNASVVLSDPKASRRHVEILLEGNTWVVRDLGAMNPTRILASNGSEQAIGQSSRRLEHGQLAVGDSIITLYPVGR